MVTELTLPFLPLSTLSALSSSSAFFSAFRFASALITIDMAEAKEETIVEYSLKTNGDKIIKIAANMLAMKMIVLDFILVDYVIFTKFMIIPPVLLCKIARHIEVYEVFFSIGLSGCRFGFACIFSKLADY